MSVFFILLIRQTEILQIYERESGNWMSRTPSPLYNKADIVWTFLNIKHCVKRGRIRSYSGPYFPTFGLNAERYEVSVQMRENAEQNNFKYGHFSRSKIYSLWVRYYSTPQRVSECYSPWLNKFWHSTKVHTISAL